MTDLVAGILSKLRGFPLDRPPRGNLVHASAFWIKVQGSVHVVAAKFGQLQVARAEPLVLVGAGRRSAKGRHGFSFRQKGECSFRA